jgi:hypothetical protein
MGRSSLRLSFDPALGSAGPSRTSLENTYAPRDPILLPLDCLRPTQVAVGMRAVAAKRRRIGPYVRKRKKLARYLERRPIPAVFGPERAFYIVDHHHLSLALTQSGVGAAYVEILDDFSAMSLPRFWSAMEERGFVYPFDETGRRVAVSRLPRDLSWMRADPYRDLAWSVREAGGFHKSQAPFSEFRWAEFFRARIDPQLVATDYRRAVAQAFALARSYSASALPGFRRH